MRIAFIWPHVNTVYQTLPLAVGFLYTNIKDTGHEIRLFNLPMEGWKPDSPAYLEAIRRFQPDLICASAWAISFKSCVAATKAACRMAPGAKVILGGNYPTLNPQEAYAPGCFDWIMMGECEQTFPRFVAAFARGDQEEIARIPGMYFRDGTGRLIRNRNVFVHDLDQIGRIDYDFIQLDRAIQRGYMRTMLGPRRKAPLFITRGCEYACNFCTAPTMNGKTARHFSVEYLCHEIRGLYEKHDIRMIYFMDDNGTQEREFFKDLCRGIIEMKLPGLMLDMYRGTRLENLDQEMCRLMKTAGFEHVTIAPESGSERVRQAMHKEMTTEDIFRVTQMIRDAGLSAQAYFIIGYPGETAEERQETYRFIEDLSFDVFSLHKYMALPGTSSFLKLVKRGLIPRSHTDESHLIGEGLPNYNGDLPRDIDREIFGRYIRFYARHPTKVRYLLYMASARGLWRSLSGTARAAMLAAAGLGRPGEATPALRDV